MVMLGGDIVYDISTNRQLFLMAGQNTTSIGTKNRIYYIIEDIRTIISIIIL
jgi:hypothetical protein